MNADDKDQNCLLSDRPDPRSSAAGIQFVMHAQSIDNTDSNLRAVGADFRNVHGMSEDG